MNKGSLVPVLLLILAFLAGTIGCGDGGEDERTDEAPKNLPPAFAGATSVRTENGSYHLLWAAATDDSTAASAITYHVYASNDPSPPSYDFASPTASVTGVALADISGLPSTGRLYFIVRACDAEGNCEENTVQQALRTFGLEKAPNFRDLGGYVNDEGRQIEWDRVFRSGELSELTDDELAFVSGFHFKRFMDLRQQLEIDRDGADRTYVGNEAIYDLLDFNVGDPY
ncbi:MAG: tyrosine-protein phosphatase, partial [Chloroflexi bacterium]|nr:tyrosine-protein phosphatase [Chloroflexota bacterium]